MSKILDRYRRSINPPHNLKDYLNLFFTFLILLALPAGIYLAKQQQDLRKRAQEEGPQVKNAETPPQVESVPDEILLKFNPGVSNEAKEQIKNEHALEVLDTIPQIEVLKVKVNPESKDAVLEALKHNPNIAYAEPNYIGEVLDTPNDTYYSSQWGLINISAPAAWDITQGNSAVTLAVIDTGIYGAHEDLQGKLVPGYNFIDNNTDTSDVNGHGTAVAGSAGAATNDAKGVASLGRNITLMPIRSGTSTGTIYFYESAQGVIFAADHGAKVINMSFGASSPDQTLQNAINYAWSKGVVVVAAAGNNGVSPILYPASGQNVLAVGGVDQNDKWTNANFGAGLDVVAPIQVYTTTKAGGYAQAGGTSFSAPMVGALVGLIMSAKPGLSNQQVVDIITSTADKVDVSAYGGYDANGWNDHYGYGRINALKALQKATGIIPQPTSTPSPSLSPTLTPIPSAPASLDTTSPTVLITSPLNGATVKVNSKVTITANASDNASVSKVEFYVAGTLKCADFVSPYTCPWSVPGKKGTSYKITAKAYDTSNNSASNNIQVTSQ